MIDVSEHQGRVDWQRVYAAGTRHAYIKATEGVQHVDRYATANYDRARQAGIVVGFYHFAHPENAPHRDAAYFLDHVAPMLRPGDLRPALDLETTAGHGWDYLNDWKAQWLAVVDHHVGTRCVFYSYFYFWKRMHLYADRPVWGAGYGAAFTPPDSWTLHQYSSTGTMPGVTGSVDLSRRLEGASWPLIPKT